MTDQVFYGKPLVFREKAHRYYWDGQAVPSVTTIINRLNKPLLIQWAADCAVEHIRAELLRQGPAASDVVAMCEAARKAHTNKRHSAGDVGRRVHKWAQDIQSGIKIDMAELSDLPAEQGKLVLNALGALREWLATTKLGHAQLERRVMSREMMYAGTTDRWGLIDGRWAVLDFKTGSGVYDEAWYQLAGYEMALREELGLTEPVWHYVIHLDKNTGRCVPYVRGPNETRVAWEVWENLVRLDKAIRAMPKMERAA